METAASAKSSTLLLHNSNSLLLSASTILPSTESFATSPKPECIWISPSESLLSPQIENDETLPTSPSLQQCNKQRGRPLGSLNRFKSASNIDRLKRMAPKTSAVKARSLETGGPSKVGLCLKGQVFQDLCQSLLLNYYWTKRLICFALPARLAAHLYN